MDIVGIGALNIDYIKSMPLLPSHSTQLLRQEFEPGNEDWVTSDDVLNQRIRKIGTTGFDYIGPGGSAFNTIRCIAQLGTDIRVGYIGVMGHDEDDCNLKHYFDKYSIDTTLVFESNQPPGKCISLYWPHKQSRGLRTAPGANVELAAKISDGPTGDKILKYLVGAKWVHLTSFVNMNCLSSAVELVTRAKSKNPHLILSFDPGSEYCRDPKSPVRKTIEIADYLFLNGKEFQQLAGYEEKQQVKGGRPEEKKMALEIFKSFQGPRLMIVLKSYNSTRFFQTYKDTILFRRYWQIPLPATAIRDDTGAGDVFAAGFIVAQLIPALSFDMKTTMTFCSRLVKVKLKTVGCDAEVKYRKALRQTFEEIRIRENLSHFERLALYLSPIMIFLLGAVSSALIGVLFSWIFL